MDVGRKANSVTEKNEAWERKRDREEIVNYEVFEKMYIAGEKRSLFAFV